MPGLVSLHDHHELPPVLEHVCGKMFPDWIMNLIRAKKDMSKQDYQIATMQLRMNINTLIQSGTTTVGEICTHGVSPALLKQAGLCAAVFHEIINKRSGIKGQGYTTRNPILSSSQLYLSKIQSKKVSMTHKPERRAGISNGLERVYILYCYRSLFFSSDRPSNDCAALQASLSPILQASSKSCSACSVLPDIRYALPR